jgi:aarF domain-containing kinase
MKPTPPEEGECCMSGCAHCIYDVYLEDLQLFHQTLVPETRTKLINILRQRRRDDSDIVDELIKLWPENTLGKRPNLTTDDDDEESKSTTAQEAKQVAQRELRKVRNSLDPATRSVFLFLEIKEETDPVLSIIHFRAFLEMEEKIKNKKK